MKTYFEGHQASQRLQTVIASVHEVPHKDVVGVRHLATASEQLLEVVELNKWKIQRVF